jgi:hypothetical protein
MREVEGGKGGEIEGSRFNNHKDDKSMEKNNQFEGVGVPNRVSSTNNI